MTEQEKVAEWVRYIKAVQPISTDAALRVLHDPYAESEKMGELVMKALGLPSLKPFREWAK
jgi:hypothetical protein